MTTAVIITITVSCATFFASVGASTFVSGMRWGKITRDMEYVQRDIRTIMEYFRLTPRDDARRNGRS